MIALAALMLTSATFKAGATMPRTTVYTGCAGQNRSPQLHWSGAPRGTRSFALVVHDPDAPHPGGWYHWVFYNIDAARSELPGSFDLPRSHGAAPPGWGINDFRETVYDGPCPPPGKPHHYHFTLYALDVARIAGNHLTAPQLLEAMRGHILAQTTLTGIYQR